MERRLADLQQQQQQPRRDITGSDVDGDALSAFSLNDDNQKAEETSKSSLMRKGAEDKMASAEDRVAGDGAGGMMSGQADWRDGDGDVNHELAFRAGTGSVHEQVQGLKDEKKRVKRQIQAWVDDFQRREGRAASPE